MCCKNLCLFLLIFGGFQHFLHNPFFSYMVVNLVCDLRRFMSHEILQYLHIHAILCISGTSSMPENVRSQIVERHFLVDLNGTL